MDDVIERYFQAIVGRERWENLRSRKTREIYSLYESTLFSENVERTLEYIKYLRHQ